MGVNRDKPDLWKTDIALSVDMYNDWFMNFAPNAYRTTRIQTTKDVEKTLKATDNLRDIQTESVRRCLLRSKENSPDCFATRGKLEQNNSGREDSTRSS